MKIIRYPHQLENFRSSLYDVEHFQYLSTVCKRNAIYDGTILKDFLRISIRLTKVIGLTSWATKIVQGRRFRIAPTCDIGQGHISGFLMTRRSGGAWRTSDSIFWQDICWYNGVKGIPILGKWFFLPILDSSDLIKHPEVSESLIS